MFLALVVLETESTGGGQFYRTTSNLLTLPRVRVCCMNPILEQKMGPLRILAVCRNPKKRGHMRHIHFKRNEQELAFLLCPTISDCPIFSKKSCQVSFMNL